MLARVRQPADGAVPATLQLAVTDSRGTAQSLAVPGIAVAGKTGTAQTGNDNPAVAWFVAFAPAQAPKVAVAVVVEDAGAAEVSGNQLAAPIARDVIEAVLR